MERAVVHGKGVLSKESKRERQRKSSEREKKERGRLGESISWL